MWAQAASAAISFLGAFGSASVEKARARINTRLSAAQAEASNIVRAGANEYKAAEGHLARWVQSVNNQRRLDMGADNLEAAVVNYRRQSDARVRERFSDSIRAAEAEGAAIARQGFSGVTGAVSDMVNASMALRQSITEQAARDFEGMAAYDLQKRKAGLMSEMIGGLDQSLIFDALDYNEDVGQTFTGPNPYLSGLTAAAPALIDIGRNLGPKSTPGVPTAGRVATVGELASNPAKFSYNFKPLSTFELTGSTQ